MKRLLLLLLCGSVVLQGFVVPAQAQDKLAASTATQPKPFSFLDNPEQYLKPKAQKPQPKQVKAKAAVQKKSQSEPHDLLEQAFNLLNFAPAKAVKQPKPVKQALKVMKAPAKVVAPPAKTPVKAPVKAPAKTQQKAVAVATPTPVMPTVDTKKVLAEVDPVDKKLPTDHFYVAQSTVPEGKIIRGGLTASVEEIDLTHRKATVINLVNPASRVSISDPEIASVVVISPTQIELVGNQVGVASLLIWDDQNSDKYAMIDLNVHRDVSVLAKQIRLINPGIKVVPMAADDSVILTGEVANRQQSQLAVEIARAYFSGGGSGGGGGTGGGLGGSGGGGAAAGPSSLSPGTAAPGVAPNIINLLQIHGQPSTKAEAVQRKLLEIDPNIKMDVVPGPDGVEKVILTGKVRSASVVSRAINMASVFYGQPGLTVVTGPGGNAVRDESGSPEFQSATAFNTNMNINILQGSIISDASGNVVSMMKVAFRPQIRCRVKILDVSRATLKQLGHSFMSNLNDLTVGSFSGARAPANGATIQSFDPTATGASIVETATEVARTGTVATSQAVTSVFGDGMTQFLTLNQKYVLALSALAERRKVRTLAEPTLVSLSGEKSSFLAGGEVPIPVIGSNGQIDIEYHEFGVRLNLVATAKDDGKIHLQVAPEISTVDNTIAVTTNIVTVPGFASRRFQTTIELGNGEAFVMAGLFSQDETESASKFPGVGSLPIIGSFFRNKFTDRRDREMVVIIQPEIIMIPNGDSSASASKSKEIVGFADKSN